MMEFKLNFYITTYVSNKPINLPQNKQIFMKRHICKFLKVIAGVRNKNSNTSETC